MMGMRASRLVLFACGLTLLGAGDALAAESQSLADKLTGSVMFAMLASIFPVGVITLYCAFRVMGGDEES